MMYESSSSSTSLSTFTVVSVFYISHFCAYEITDFNLHFPDDVEYFSHAYLTFVSFS